MTWNKNSNSFNLDEEGKELAYDLRQGLAKILFNIMLDCETQMQDRDYRSWNESVDRLFMFISMKLDKDEKNEYNNKVNELNKIIDDDPNAYMDKEIEGREIYSKLKNLTMWVLAMMEKYHMFGSKEIDDGL